jgi:hypothetical protein
VEIFASAGYLACGFQVAEKRALGYAVTAGNRGWPEPVAVFAFDHVALGMAADLAFAAMARQSDKICFVFRESGFGGKDCVRR